MPTATTTKSDATKPTDVCIDCGGSEICPVCDGDGEVDGEVDGDECADCHGSGDCLACSEKEHGS